MQNDGGVAGAKYVYGDFGIEGLLTELLPEVERTSGLQLFPTYSYLRMYNRGANLKKHTDRSSCEISLKLCLGFEALLPICIEGPSGVVSVNLARGDALLYWGHRVPALA